MSTPLLALRDVELTFGGTPLFAGVTAWVGAGDKTCLVGRNGSGKSTLLKVMAGEILPDAGSVFRQPGIRVAVLPQEPVLEGASVADYVAAGLPPHEQTEEQQWQVAATLEALKLSGDADPTLLSGGEGRRAALARTLVSQPDVLLLDEPTNHLDLPTILWLEEWLQAYNGALVLISHDRRFLETVSRQTLWLEQGEVRRAEFGFAGFSQWQDETYTAAETELDRQNNRLRQELHWLARGVTARRKRNMGRRRALDVLRQSVRQRLVSQQDKNRQVKLAVAAGEKSGQMVMEATKVCKNFGDRPVVKDFSVRIQRGDRIGIIGPNGAGKTTLLRLLTGDLPPDSGTVQLGTNLEPSFFDQKRERLNPDATLWDTLTDGRGDNVWVRGEPRHVVGYLRDFLFSEAQARTPVKALSGGERNRLLLAKLLAKPSNLLILDEPTNDLDMDTLDLLEEVLADYDGTLLVVSHDRDFLDRLVSSTLVMEGDGKVGHYAGGYADYLRQRGEPTTQKPAAPSPQVAERKERPRTATKLSYKEQRELDELPGRIDALAAKIADLETKLSDSDLYSRDPDQFHRLTTTMDTAVADHAAAEERWLELESKREELERG